MLRTSLPVVLVFLAGCQAARHAESPPSEYSLEVAATAMSTARVRQDIAANNVANLQTPGFKATRVVLEDLPYHERLLGSPDGARVAVPVGRGVRVAATRMDMSQGPATCTGRSLDVLIEGPGFLTLRSNTQEPGLQYTRAGVLSLSASGELVTSSGQPLEPSLVIPVDAVQVMISPTGEVSALLPGETEPAAYGQLQLTRFVSPESLRPVSAGVFVETPQSGAPMISEPGVQGCGTIRQGFFEGSNVDIDQEVLEFARARAMCRAFVSFGLAADTLASVP